MPEKKIESQSFESLFLAEIRQSVNRTVRDIQQARKDIVLGKTQYAMLSGFSPELAFDHERLQRDLYDLEARAAEYVKRLG